ncbi:hypothetical protein AWW67_02220 [Roseivirga seohaensis]|uniref:DUF2806 domain-containing protein n=1 Tax=Roseivirga seohaensis TaxID=1914963 RepID=A0A150XZD0_9BACT|nr:DUF2806 domain-containing protein [Roseivirga seohaensis]KYG83955.1 hypothetical protein AWW67_02220 [Roseivirga seohaensis]
MNSRNNSNLPEKQYEVKTWLGQFLVELKHIELPSVIEDNLIRSTCKLLTGLTDIPAAYLHEYKRRIERETEALDILSRANVESIVNFNKKDSELIASTANYYSIQLYKEAGNRKAILEKAIYQLGDKTYSEDTNKQIDEDWLSRFAKIANDVSKEEVQLILAKILAGEISKPGSFSTMTLKVLERMDKRAADQFSEFLSYCSSLTFTDSVIILAYKNYQSPYTKVLRTAIPQFVMNAVNQESIPTLEDFSFLIDVGILRPIIISKKIPFSDLRQFHIGSTEVYLTRFRPELMDEDDVSFSLECMELTTAGKELLPFIKPNPAFKEYCEQLDYYFRKKMGYVLEYPDKD